MYLEFPRRIATMGAGNRFNSHRTPRLLTEFSAGYRMPFPHEFNEEEFYRLWSQVRIERQVNYGLFTFGDSDLPYLLVCGARTAGGTVTVTKGEVKITRPLIITPDTVQPGFENFFESADDEQMVQFILARTAAFRHLRLANQNGRPEIVSDSVEEAVDRLNRRLDDDDEDRVAILSAPPDLGRLAVLRYAVERVVSSAPDNIQELRDRGFLG